MDGMDAVYAELFPNSTPKGDERRIEILNAAIDSLVEDGVDKTNFNTLGKRLKMGRAHIKYYFRTREEILDAAVQFVINCGQKATIEALREANTREERVRAFVAGAFRWYKRDPKQMKLLLLFFYQTGIRKSRFELHSKIRAAGLNRIRSILEEFSIHSDEAERRGRAIQNLITGAIVAHSTSRTVSLHSLQRETEALALSIAKHRFES